MTTSDSGSSTSAGGGSTSQSTSESGGTTASDSSGDGEPLGGESGSCTSDYQPVCGSDRETYDHPCDVPKGVTIRREGPCFGDCEGSCTVVGSPSTSMALAFAMLIIARRRRR